MSSLLNFGACFVEGGAEREMMKAGTYGLQITQVRIHAMSGMRVRRSCRHTACLILGFQPCRDYSTLGGNTAKLSLVVGQYEAIPAGPYRGIEYAQGASSGAHTHIL